MVSERAAIVATGNLLSGLIVELQKQGVLIPKDTEALVRATYAKSAGETPEMRAEVREFLQNMFPGARLE